MGERRSSRHGQWSLVELSYAVVVLPMECSPWLISAAAMGIWGIGLMKSWCVLVPVLSSRSIIDFILVLDRRITEGALPLYADRGRPTPQECDSLDSVV